MAKTRNRFPFLKPVSALLVFSLLFSQAAWAVDIQQMIQNAKSTFEQEEQARRSGLSASDLQIAQAGQQAAVDQQQALEDLQNLNFSLTTPGGDVLKYVGDKLSGVDRPDGTKLRNIVTDAGGGIVSSDLLLSDGSIQVFQGGQVLGYRTPDGTQVLYESGRIQKTISTSGEETLYSYALDAQGNVAETTLDSSSRLTKYGADGKIKETTRKADGQKIFYANGMIQRIVNADGSEIQFASQVVDGDTVLTPQSASPANAYIDAQGNRFNFSEGVVSSIVLADGSIVDGITWDANDKIDGATLTQADGSRFIYQSKQLTRSYDPASIVTNYTYTATTITASTDGNVWEYLLDGTPVRYTDLSGDVSTFFQSGTYKGLKATETIGGVTYTYAYQGSGATLTAQRAGPGSTTTVLPVGTADTLARSKRSDGSSAWMTAVNSGTTSLYTYWGNSWLDYGVTLMGQADLQIDLEAVNIQTAGLPPGYTHFQIEVFVDGVSKGIQYVPAHSTLWQAHSFTLEDLASGNHTIRLKWLNDLGGPNNTNANFRFRNLKFTQATSSVVETVTEGFEAAALTPRVETFSDSPIVKPSAPGTIGSTDFTSIAYDSAARLKQVLFQDGSKLLFDEGVLQQALDPSGKTTGFDFEQSALSNIVGSSIVQSGLTSTYSAEGKLSSVKVGDIAIHYKDDEIEWLEKTDGTELWGPVFDADGALQDAVIYSPDGEERAYQAGKLVRLRRPDQTRLIYADDKPVQMITPENLTYNFTYSPSKIEAALETTAAPDALTPIRMEYDLDFNLQKVTRQNQEILNYLNAELTQIDAPDQAAKIFDYQKDAGGNVLSYTVTQGNVVTHYDAADNPVSAVIGPTAENPHTFDVSYSYGRIREIRKDGTAVFNYSYSIDAESNEITVVEDLEGNTLKTYKDGNLLTSLDRDTQVLTGYEYAEFVIASPEGAKQSKVSRVTVSRFGRMFHDYVYAYDGDNAVVTDEEGIVRTYGPDEKLLFLERNGEKFAYSYDTVQVEAPGGTAEAVLPVGLYDTAARSTRSDGSSAWMTGTNSGIPYLLTWWGNSWVDYQANPAADGDLKIEFQAVNSDTDGLPAGYTHFQIEVFVDGASRGVQYVPAHSTQWQDYSFTLDGVAAGVHTVRLKWLNDVGGANGTNANFKFRNLKFTQVGTGTVTETKEITTESLVEKRLPDDTRIRYAAGKVDEIRYADGRILKDLVENENGDLVEVRLFASAQDAAGVKINFSDGAISKITLSSNQELDYSYDKDASGNVVATWVQKGAAHLKYDAQNNLVGLRIDGVMSPDEILAITTHNYTGGNAGFLGYDGNPATAQTGAFGGGSGSGSTYLLAEHVLPEANAITGFSYRMDTYAYSSGDSDNGSSAFIYLETRDATTGQWSTVPGTYAAQNHGNGGDGGSTAYARTPGTGLTTIAVDIPNVIAVRANARAAAYSNAGGEHGGQAYIYEVQFTLADESALSFNTIVGGTGETAGYTFSGYAGSIGFDAVGNLTHTEADLASIQQELVGVIQNYAAMPHSNSSLLQMWAALSDNETITQQEYDASGKLETQTKADGTVTLFDNDKPAVVLDKKGIALIEYGYDADGNPSRVYLKNARDTLPDHMAAARLEIEEKRAESLRNLAAQKNLAYQSLEAQFQNARIVLEANLASQNGLRDNISNIEAKGKEAKSQKSEALGLIDDNIADLQVLLAATYGQEADAYAALDGQIKTISDQIKADAETADEDLKTQETNLKREILRQEVSPIIYDYYRRILGRDPSTPEYDGWISQIDYSSGVTGEAKLTNGQLLTQALSSSLNASPELAERQAYVNAIKAAVTNQINGYLSMTQAQKEAFAATLGLAPADLIPLSSPDAEKVLAWINSRSLHFGQSAFLALESLLDQKEISYSRETLARQAIVIDILSGVISPLDDGDLVLSVFALNKTAKLYGVDLVGANLSWEDLRSVLASPPQAGEAISADSPRIIAHINGNHFVVVTAMTDDSITYIDPGKGKDKQNESLTVSKTDFLKVWKGNAALENVLAQSILASPPQAGEAISARLLSDEETKSIRGAFLPLLFAWAAAAIANIGSAVWAVLNAIGTVLASIGTMVGNIVQNIGFALSKLGEGLSYIGKGLFEGIKFAASTIGKFFANPFASAAAQGAPASLSVQGFGHALFQTAVKSSLSIALSKGLDALGLPPAATAVVSAVASGGILNGFSSGAFELGAAVGGAIEGALLSGGQLVMQNAGIDGPLSQTLSLVTAPLIGGFQSGEIAGALVQIAKELPTLGSFYGIQKAGEALGIDPRLSALVATPVAGAVTGLSKTIFNGPARNPNLDIDSRPINSDTGETIQFDVTPSWWDGVYSFVQNSLPSVMTAANSSYYLSKSETIQNSTSSATNTTADPGLPEGAQAVEYQDPVTGQTKAAYKIGGGENYTIYDAYTGSALKRVSPDTVEEGKFVYQIAVGPNGEISLDLDDPAYLSEGNITYETTDQKHVTFKINEKNVQEIRIEGPSSDVILAPSTTTDAVGKILDGAVEILSLAISLIIQDGSVTDARDGQGMSSQELTRKLQTAYIFGNGFENLVRPEDSEDPLMKAYYDDLQYRDGLITAEGKYVVLLYELTRLFGNGLDWFTDFEVNDNVKAFVEALERGGEFLHNLIQNPLADLALPTQVQAWFGDFREWYLSYSGAGNSLVQETVRELENLQWGTPGKDPKGAIQDGIAFAHSGFTAPLLTAIDLMQYDVETVLIYEGPHPNYAQLFTNPNLKRIIHVMGSNHGLMDSFLEGDVPVPYLDWANFSNTTNTLENINIEIQGAFHNDFSYDEAAWDAKIAAVTGPTQAVIDAHRSALMEQKERNRRVNIFMRRLYQFALTDQTSPGDLNGFLESLRLDGIATFENDIWIVNLENFEE